MSKSNVVELSGRDTSRDELTELIRDGARKLISEALEAGVSQLLSTLSGWRDHEPSPLSIPSDQRGSGS